MTSIPTFVDLFIPRSLSATYANTAASSAQHVHHSEQVDAAFEHFRHSDPAYDATKTLDALRATE